MDLHRHRKLISFMRVLPLLICQLGGPAAMGQDPALMQQLLEHVGLKPHDGMRGQMDIIGFASTAQQMDSVFAMCTERAKPRQDSLRAEYGWNGATAFRAGICPHDDYGYAGRMYPLLLAQLRSPRVILFGVFHKAKVFGCADVLVFDSFEQWHGPYGPVRVSSLRDEITAALPEQDFIVNDDMQQVEHSVEAIVPWLQAYNPDVEIVSILVPYMDWETMDHLAADLSQALTKILARHGWAMGKDVALICSTDAVHYGDDGWGGSNFAPLGVDVAGYQQAVSRDLTLARENLAGVLGLAGLQRFFTACVDPDDVFQYRITWCGRFSVPFGLNVAVRLAAGLGEPPLQGVLLDYGTSVSEATLPMESLSGMGFTAPNNLHHWVGYAAVGYR